MSISYPNAPTWCATSVGSAGSFVSGLYPRFRLPIPAVAWICSILMFLGPAVALAAGVAAANAPEAPTHPATIPEITALIGVIGGIMTGLAAIWQRVSENKWRIRSLEERALAGDLIKAEQSASITALKTQNAAQASELESLRRGQNRIQTNQAEANARHEDRKAAQAGVEVVIDTLSQQRRDDKAAPSEGA